MSLKHGNALRILSIGSALAFFSLVFNQASAQVPSQSSGKALSLVITNELTRPNQSVEAPHSTGGIVKSPVRIVAHTPIPFGTVSKVLLDMKGYDQEFVRSFIFKNNTQTKFTIQNIEFDKGSQYFDFVGLLEGGVFPYELIPGETITVKVAFHSVERNKLYSGNLIFVTDQEKEPLVYEVQALQQPLSDMPWNKKPMASTK
ncbi:MAG: hypothetical protein WCH46_07700 [bacterium]